MSKRHSKGPLTKGGALIQARKLLGPAAFVFSRGQDHYIGVAQYRLFQGLNWEQALQAVKESPEAKAWTEAQILVDAEIATAVNSFRAVRKKKLLETLGRVKELTQSKFKKIHVRLPGLGRCACGKVISGNKAHCAGCPSPFRPELPEPQEVEA